MSVESVAHPSGLVWRRAGRGVWESMTLACRFVARLGKGAWYSRRWLAACYVGWLASLFVVGIDSRAAHVGMWVALALWVLPLIVGVLWSLVNPFTFDRWVAGPWRRHQWRRWARKNWDELARECHLSVQRTRVEKVTRRIRVGDHPETAREPRDVSYWVAPYLARVTTQGDLLTLRVRARLGQTLEEIEAAVPALQVAVSATSGRCVFVSECQVEIQLVMRNALASGREACVLTRDELPSVGVVPAGRTQRGTTWQLCLTGRHTLVVGCSGSGKGSPMWSACGGLAPAVPTGEVQLWGIDLKHGIELAMGKQLFFCTATTPAQALEVLRQLKRVVEVRGEAMAGVSRLHEPRPGDPLHVLVIDELAVLTSYGPLETVKESSRLLSEILTQGRALGVVVLACVQDPRKEVVAMRNLFTQTLALRLRTVSETRMVLGEDSAALAPHTASCRRSRAPAGSWTRPAPSTRCAPTTGPTRPSARLPPATRPLSTCCCPPRSRPRRGTCRRSRTPSTVSLHGRGSPVPRASLVSPEPPRRTTGMRSTTCGVAMRHDHHCGGSLRRVR